MWIKRALGTTAGVFAVAFGLIGLAHSPYGKPLLPIVSGMERSLGHYLGARCPFGYDLSLTPAQREQNAVAFAAKHAGTTAAASRPALGWSFDGTTRADILAWADANHIDCGKRSAMGFDLACQTVPQTAVFTGFNGIHLGDVNFNFGSGGTLLQVSATSIDNPENVSRAFQELSATVAGKAGPPALTRGDGSVKTLQQYALAQAVTEFRFTDYYAVIRATNNGRGTFSLTQTYRALPKAAGAQLAAQ